MAQQTAVEWFFTQVIGSLHSTMSKADIDKALEQAKEMEKEQIMDAFVYGDYNGFCRYKSIGPDDVSSEEYYNETFNK